jgi:exonuclease III
MYYLRLIIMVKVLTLNVRGIKGPEKQNHLALYAKRQRADILLLQETNLPDITDLPTLHQYNIIQNPAIHASSGTAIGISTQLQLHIMIHSQHNLIPGYLQTCHITLHNIEFQILNIYMPINTIQAINVANTLKTHLANIPIDRQILIGGDWNVTLTPQDRENHTEKRTALAQLISRTTQMYNLIDVWRRTHPESNQYTYRGNQPTHPKSRLDRIYISKQWIHQTHSPQICPTFADHAGLSLNLTPPQRKQRPTLWRFQNQLLNDNSLIDIITTIIKYYVATATEKEDIQQLWDDMKREIKLQTQRYEEHQRRQKNQQYAELEQQIEYLTKQQTLTETEERVLNTVGTTLQQKFQQDAKRRILQNYNLNQHMKKAQRPIFPKQTSTHTSAPQLQTLKIQDTLITEPNQIRKEVRNYYRDFYNTKGNNPNIREDLLSEIPTLEEDERQKCDAPITMNELLGALQDSKPGKAPGLDGLTYEFYKQFWKELSPLLLEVVNTSLQQEQLPTSMLNGIITLIPKKGDLTQLANWRPITLLNTDYKLITRSLAKRLTTVLPKLITTDQSYCIPNRSIHTNLHLIRDSIDYANQRNLPLAVISLDQASAYDRVEHPYIFHVLEKFGFGEKFIKNIRTMYRNGQGLVKINGVLTAPFPYARGVRQGDPLSGPLFTLTIEPFLLMCNHNLQNYGLTVPSSIHKTLVTTAYADDVTVFITRNEGFPQLLHNFMTYGALSGATLNIQKSTGLFVGKWKTRTDRPLGFQWNMQGGKFLGIYLGNTTAWQQQNWSELETKTRTVLNQWTKIPHTTSFQERKLILNQIVTAKLTHVLTILPPTIEFLNTINKLMIQFTWQGQHWKHPNFVYAKLEDGGIGVHHLPSRIQTQRFTFLQKFIANNNRGNAWHFQAYNIRTYSPALQAEDILKLRLNPAKYSVMPPFYASAFKAWHTMTPIQNPNLQSYDDLRSTPIQESTLLTPHISGHSLLFDKMWSTLNIHYLGDLLKDNGDWKKIEHISKEQCSQPTIRRLATNLHTAETFFRHHYPNLLPQGIPLPPYPPFVIQQHNNNLTPLHIPKRTLYKNFLKLHLDQHVMVNGECHWKLGKPKWETAYHPPILSKDGDIAWKILHNSITTP